MPSGIEILGYQMKRNPKSKTLSWFSIILIGVSILSVISLIISVIFAAFFPEPTQLQVSLFETCSTTWKMGFGSFVTLLGTKLTEFTKQLEQ